MHLEQKFGSWLLGIGFFVWLTNYFWVNIGLSALPRFVDIVFVAAAVIMFLFDKRYRAIVIPITMLIIYTIILTIIAYMLDKIHPYKNVIYIKTLIYITIAPLAGSTVAYVIVKERYAKHILAAIAASFKAFVVGFIAIALSAGWRPGLLLLDINLANMYQGVGRIMAAAIIVMSTTAPTVQALNILIIYMATFVILSYRSIAAAVGALIGISHIAINMLTSLSVNQKIKAGIIMLLTSVIIIYVYGQEIRTVYQSTINRVEQKVEGKEGRPYLMISGIQLWLSGPRQLILGAGPMKYACALGYCAEGEYRHPHNAIVLLLVWYGLLGVPLIYTIIYITIKASKMLLRRSERQITLISYLYIYYLFLSMIGGDIEQNRQFISMLSAVWVIQRMRIKNTNNTGSI